jgi:hypothetical protein
MHLSSRQNKNTTYKNYNSKSIKKGKVTRAHRSPRLHPELERRLDSTPNRASLLLLLLNQNLYKWRTIRKVWCVWILSWGSLYRGRGESTDSIKSVWRWCTAGRPSTWPVGHPSQFPPTLGHRILLWTDVWTKPPSLGLNRLKVLPVDHGVGPAGRP